MQAKEEYKLKENFIEEVNKELENKLNIKDIEQVIEITDSISDEFKSKIVEGQDIKNKKVYCIILNTSITDMQLLEYLKSLIITDEGVFLFYNKDMWLD